MKAIMNGEIKNIPYAMISHDRVSLIQCDASACNNIFTGGTIAILSCLSKDGELKTIRGDVGKVIESKNNSVRVQFNTVFPYDNELYALLLPNIPKFKNQNTLILVYKEA